MVPFPAIVQDDLWVETNGPTSKSKPTQNFIGDMEWNWIPRSHNFFPQLVLRGTLESRSIYILILMCQCGGPNMSFNVLLVKLYPQPNVTLQKLCIHYYQPLLLVPTVTYRTGTFRFFVVFYSFMGYEWGIVWGQDLWLKGHYNISYSFCYNWKIFMSCTWWMMSGLLQIKSKMRIRSEIQTLVSINLALPVLYTKLLNHACCK